MIKDTAASCKFVAHVDVYLLQINYKNMIFYHLKWQKKNENYIKRKDRCFLFTHFSSFLLNFSVYIWFILKILLLLPLLWFCVIGGIAYSINNKDKSKRIRRKYFVYYVLFGFEKLRCTFVYLTLIFDFVTLTYWLW